MRVTFSSSNNSFGTFFVLTYRISAQRVPKFRILLYESFRVKVLYHYTMMSKYQPFYRHKHCKVWMCCFIQHGIKSYAPLKLTPTFGPHHFITTCKHGTRYQSAVCMKHIARKVTEHLNLHYVSYLLDWFFGSTSLSCEVTRSHAP